MPFNLDETCDGSKVNKVANKLVNMIFGHLPADDAKLMLNGYLPQYIPGSHRNLPRQYALAILRYPHYVNFEVCLCMGANLITSHSDTYYSFLRLKARGFNHP